jgi:hypothetical protein
MDYKYYTKTIKNHTKYLEYFEYLNSFLEKQCMRIFVLRERWEKEGIPEKEIDENLLRESAIARKLHIMLDDMNPRLIQDLDFANTYTIKPTQTLLLYNPKKTLEGLPPDCSRLLVKVLTSISPLSSFQDTALETEMSFEEIARCVKHLLYWKQGKLIYPIQVNNIYRVGNNAKVTREAAIKFANFLKVNKMSSKLGFDDFMFIFSMPQIEKDKIKYKFSNQKDLYEIIIYLLRNNLISENFYYYYLLYPLRKEQEIAKARLEYRVRKSPSR